jgi:hypothetical protein
MKYKSYPIVSQEEIIDKCIEAVTGETKLFRRYKPFIGLAINCVVAEIVINSLLKSMKEKEQ